MNATEIKAIIESLLFVSDTPLKIDRLVEVTGCDREIVQQALTELADNLRAADRGIELAEIAEGFQLRTKPELAEWIRRYLRGRPFRFSRAALETLAIVAYRQPVTRAEIEYLRGVDAGGVLKTLMDKRLIRMLGKKDIPGRPLIYGTTREFLEFFSLRDLTELPTLKDFSTLSPELLATVPEGEGELHLSLSEQNRAT